MMTVNSIKLNNISNINNRGKKYVSFKESNSVANNPATLSLQGPNALVNFERNSELTDAADTVRHPLTSFFYKIAKAIRIFFGKKPPVSPEIEEASLYYNA